MPGVLFYTRFLVFFSFFSFFLFCLFLKSSFLRLKNYIFRTVSKNSRVHTPLTFLKIFLVFVQNSKKRQIFLTFHCWYYTVIIYRFSSNFYGMFPQARYT